MKILSDGMLMSCDFCLFEIPAIAFFESCLVKRNITYTTDHFAACHDEWLPRFTNS